MILSTGYFISHLRGAGVDDEAVLEAATSSSVSHETVPTSLVALPEPASTSGPAADAAPTPRPAAKPPAKAAKAAPPRAPITVPDPPNEHVGEATEPPLPPLHVAILEPDRWHLLAEAVERCAGEGGIGGLICEQRARWHYCDGYWNKVAQCPGAMGSDYPR